MYKWRTRNRHCLILNMKKWYSNSTLRKICDGQKFKSILPDMRKIDDKNTKVNMHQRRGRLIEVYDGRSWPVKGFTGVYNRQVSYKDEIVIIHINEKFVFIFTCNI
ncbi:hypothetical protein KUTeg_001793 [Tegillarca granosa]|uniref:Uncharacterized protein n=1 Tax=Tegillarca granosa TaxID=220873 RepID=A0ABQ9FTX6_TEGGR|nr:hypothetical protein KUTeg_001793 [Tegillarca granosa]